MDQHTQIPADRSVVGIKSTRKLQTISKVTSSSSQAPPYNKGKHFHYPQCIQTCFYLQHKREKTKTRSRGENSESIPSKKKPIWSVAKGAANHKKMQLQFAMIQATPSSKAQNRTSSRRQKKEMRFFVGWGSKTQLNSARLNCRAHHHHKDNQQVHTGVSIRQIHHKLHLNTKLLTQGTNSKVCRKPPYSPAPKQNAKPKRERHMLPAERNHLQACTCPRDVAASTCCCLERRYWCSERRDCFNCSFTMSQISSTLATCSNKNCKRSAPCRLCANRKQYHQTSRDRQVTMKQRRNGNHTRGLEACLNCNVSKPKHKVSNPNLNSIGEKLSQSAQLWLVIPQIQIITIAHKPHDSRAMKSNDQASKNPNGFHQPPVKSRPNSNHNNHNEQSMSKKLCAYINSPKDEPSLSHTHHAVHKSPYPLCPISRCTESSFEKPDYVKLVRKFVSREKKHRSVEIVPSIRAALE
ncbi:hypothetical protein KC19_VG050200 [Ceratodon purpureus]|uniref:Uncharacterized protein n=1 Tax=Ceratodon purpureus TaxID=3225 RepID=A0A8T0HME9_CERPU|nr:hypothetical protein KC19_VG050200 [Ceratodon purpureus]